MAFEEVRENIEDLKAQGEEVFNANVKYYKLLAFKLFMQTNAMVAKVLLLGALLLMVLFFFSFAASFAIGEALGNYGYGFLIVGAFYLLLAFIVYKMRNKIVDGPLLSNFSKILLKDD
ncbi:competence protein [Flavobacterium salilacus subsp. salilacus]|uniref:competence protein n=1 Tax=Flavobacterium TaxID=237 RepID=UPI001074A710|nr:MULTISPECIES: competence protein [Flavobacterium]KAF2519015.1 competence protein [Flavobacterium salilacus subsp. salilacus]MBE1614822.1 competence protein [Flavobacterium sp. SaA2.13]NDI98519.1 competence protein [Flavobacterium salilacus subsp. altitudinum]